MSIEHSRQPEGDLKSRGRLLTWDEIQSSIPYTRQHIARLEKAGKFPLRVQCGGNQVAWWEDEILEFLESLPRGPIQKRTRAE